MSVLPRVTESTREKVAREFDDRGSRACVAAAVNDMERHNPELLEMAMRCARDLMDPDEVMVGLCMFYSLLTAELARPDLRLRASLPRVAAPTRDRLVQEINAKGPQRFTVEHLASLERDNPELLQMAHRFAARHTEYPRLMQGFALLWASLSAQLKADRAMLH